MSPWNLNFEELSKRGTWCTFSGIAGVGVGVAVLQGLLFAIGGYLEGKTSTDAVECYNPRTKR